MTRPGRSLASFSDAYMTVAEIAAAFRVSKQMVYLLIKEKELEAVRIGRLLRVTECAVRDRLGNPHESYWTVEEVARAFRVSKMTIYRLIENGKVEAVEFFYDFRVSERYIRNCLGNPDEPYKTVSEVRKLLRVSKGTVYGLIWRGELEAIRISNLFRITGNSVSRFLGQPVSLAADEVIGTLKPSRLPSPSARGHASLNDPARPS